jgi:uncharacterized protein YyaL (SSP411 family)
MITTSAALLSVLLAPAAERAQAMTTSTSPHTNRLIHATSPYLLQHAHNPIDWYEWSDEAFAKAAAESKPVFLSIGYAACHWCHVMAHECFEDAEVAAYLNAHFISIKVDREERPDVDEIYMQVTQALNQGRGGWPMSVFLLPDKRPIYAGTYFPKDHFLHLCRRIHELWTTERQRVEEQGGQLQEYLREWAAGAPASTDVIPAGVVEQVAELLSRHIDPQRGGFRSDGNKFPPSMAMELMLRSHQRNGDPTLLESVHVTLQNMAYGGIYDQVGGGICRYSTDPEWLVPHFEKMLYDQAIVSGIYLDAYQATGEKLYADVARDIFAYVLEDLQAPEGGFYSTRDADSEGLEGAYYVWTVDEILAVLGKDEGELACRYWDVSTDGNWFEPHGHAPEGPKNILHVTKPPEVFAELVQATQDELEARIASWRGKLKEARARRVPPGLDDKILTSWNGLMIASLAKGARVLDEPRFAEAAAKAADFVLANLRRDGRLLRTHRRGQSRLTAFLDDYAFFIEGLLNLYEATFEERWLREAAALADVAREHHLDREGGGFFFTAHDGEALIARTKSAADGALPSGNAVHAMNLLRQAVLLDRREDRALAEGVFRAFRVSLENSPAQHERLLAAVDFYHDRPKEIAIVGPADDERTRALVRAVYAMYLPNKVVAGSDAPCGMGEEVIPLLRGKSLVDGKPSAYVCESYMCARPVTTADELKALLDR